MEGIVHNTNQWLLAAVPAARVVAATWYGVSVWRATPPTALYGNIILGAAAILMLVSGCGLIALMFHCRRKDHDESARSNRAAPG
jgi:hypothetical protein